MPDCRRGEEPPQNMCFKHTPARLNNFKVRMLPQMQDWHFLDIEIVAVRLCLESWTSIFL